VGLSVASTGVSLSRDNTTSRTSITTTARYSLVDSASGRALFSATSRATDAYDVLVSDYATLVSRDDAVNRALREVSDDIRTRLAVYFQDRKVKASAAD
jgi:LPS-assembly lipoprotein